MPGLGIGIGLPFNNTNRSLPYKDDLSLYINERSGDTMVDTFGNNATLLFPEYNKLYTNKPIYLSDNGNLDINKASGFTLCGWVNSKTTDKSTIRVFFGKSIQGTRSGSYHIGANVTTGYFYALIRTTTGAYISESTVDSTSSGQKFLRLSFNNVTKKLKFFIDEVQIGNEVSVSGTISTLADNYKFCIGGANNGVGTDIDSYPAIANISEVKIYPFELTEAQGLILFNKGNVSSALADYPLAGNLIDCSGNNYHLSGNEEYNYTTTGSRRMLNYNYSVWKREDSRDIFIPFKMDGTSISNPGLPAGYEKYKDVYPTVHGINLFPFTIRMVGGDWDKSDANKFNIFARKSVYYNSSHPTEWNSAELNQFIINNLCTPEHLGKIFIKGESNSINCHDRVLEFFSYTAVKTNSDYLSVLRYTHDLSVMPTITTDYYYSSTHYAAIKGDKILAFNDSTGELSLSLDGGNTFTITKSSSLTTITFAWIFDDGNIMFCDGTKVYYSNDNLLTYSESTVIGIDGNPFVPTAVDNFIPFNDNKSFTIEGIEHKVWGNYSVNAATEYININVWHTLDGGQTIKSIYKANTTLTPSIATPARHAHGIFWNPISSKLLLMTGDVTTECNWLECSSSDNFTNSFVWSVTKAWTDSGYSKSAGGGFDSTAFYWVGDATAKMTKNGIYKIPYSNITEEYYYKKLFSTTLNGGNMYAADGKYIVAFGGYKGLVVSKDGKNFHIVPITGGPDISLITTRTPYIQITPPNNDGYHKLTIYETTEDPYIAEVVKGVVLMFKIE